MQHSYMTYCSSSLHNNAGVGGCFYRVSEAREKLEKRAGMKMTGKDWQERKWREGKLSGNDGQERAGEGCCFIGSEYRCDDRKI